MSAPLRKGWCPGALRPMAAKDGLLVRLRITGGILPARVAAALADLAARHGNGLLDLSARGNLQMRGVTDATFPWLQDGLATFGLLDADADGEAIRNVIASPLAGLHAGPDIRPLTSALERRLTSDAALYALPNKFGFLVDDSSAPSLAGIDADMRFDWLAEEECFSIGLAGTRVSAIRIGTCEPDQLVESAARIAHVALSLFARHTEARRMRDLVVIAGTDVFTDVCCGRLRAALPVSAEIHALDVVGLRNFAGPPSPVQRGRGTVGGGGGGTCASPSTTVGTPVVPSTMLRMVPLPRFAEEDLAHKDSGCLGLAAPFGRLDATMLRAAAELASTTPNKELRLTPWRVILVPGVSSAGSEVAGFITDPSDPRLTIAACVGSNGCERGTTQTYRDATALAACLHGKVADDIALHVSGCAKGCAKASDTAITLVARDGLYDIVRDGRAGDAATKRGLDLVAAKEAVEAALARLPEPA